MLFGKILKQSISYTFSPDILDTEDVGPVLSINNIALESENQSQTSLWVKKNGQQFLIANLNKNKPHSFIEINLFIQDQAELFVKGQGKIHIVGKFQIGQEPFDSQNLYENEEISQDQQQQLLKEQNQQEDSQSSQQVVAHFSKSKSTSILNNNNSSSANLLTQSLKFDANTKSSKTKKHNDQDSDEIGSLDSFIDDEEIIDGIEIDDNISDEDHFYCPQKSSNNSYLKYLTHKIQNKPLNQSISINKNKNKGKLRKN